MSNNKTEIQTLKNSEFKSVSCIKNNFVPATERFFKNKQAFPVCSNSIRTILNLIRLFIIIILICPTEPHAKKENQY